MSVGTNVFNLLPIYNQNDPRWKLPENKENKKENEYLASLKNNTALTQEQRVTQERTMRVGLALLRLENGITGPSLLRRLDGETDHAYLDRLKKLRDDRKLAVQEEALVKDVLSELAPQNSKQEVHKTELMQRSSQNNSNILVEEIPQVNGIDGFSSVPEVLDDELGYNGLLELQELRSALPSKSNREKEENVGFQPPPGMPLAKPGEDVISYILRQQREHKLDEYQEDQLEELEEGLSSEERNRLEERLKNFENVYSPEEYQEFLKSKRFAKSQVKNSKELRSDVQNLEHDHAQKVENNEENKKIGNNEKPKVYNLRLLPSNGDYNLLPPCGPDQDIVDYIINLDADDDLTSHELIQLENLKYSLPEEVRERYYRRNKENEDIELIEDLEVEDQRNNSELLAPIGDRKSLPPRGLDQDIVDYILKLESDESLDGDQIIQLGKLKESLSEDDQVRLIIRIQTDPVDDVSHVNRPEVNKGNNAPIKNAPINNAPINNAPINNAPIVNKPLGDEVDVDELALQEAIQNSEKTFALEKERRDEQRIVEDILDETLRTSRLPKFLRKWWSKFSWAPRLSPRRIKERVNDFAAGTMSAQNAIRLLVDIRQHATKFTETDVSKVIDGKNYSYYKKAAMEEMAILEEEIFQKNPETKEDKEYYAELIQSDRYLYHLRLIEAVCSHEDEAEANRWDALSQRDEELRTLLNVSAR